MRLYKKIAVWRKRKINTVRTVSILSHHSRARPAIIAPILRFVTEQRYTFLLLTRYENGSPRRALHGRFKLAHGTTVLESLDCRKTERLDHSPNGLRANKRGRQNAPRNTITGIYSTVSHVQTLHGGVTEAIQVQIHSTQRVFRYSDK